ncbi:hypothetical protein AWC38_SpisGene16921 [Stylophora pistillata]|uniref:Uncharacterized protein n=1 Tax=Stylophora pistillata TaxID=50429 RepID=A0A2B4RPH1_STYPI|nr:hypothetical protein AWC38_SpisGene16921 [Stylophora pistillata]
MFWQDEKKLDFSSLIFESRNLLAASLNWSDKKMVLVPSVKETPKEPLDTSTRSSEDKDPEIAIIDKEPGASDSSRKKNMKRKQECLEDKELVQNILRDNKVVRSVRQQHELDELQAAHFNKCQKRYEEAQRSVKKKQTLDSLWKKGNCERLSSASSSNSMSQDEQEEFTGADAIESGSDNHDETVSSSTKSWEKVKPCAFDEAGHVDKKDSIRYLEGRGISDANLDGDLTCFNLCVENAHPVAIKFNQLLEKGKILDDCLYYKFIDNTTSFASVNPKSASVFTWDRDVCEFFDTIKYLGGSRTRNFVRGPGFFGTGRGGLKELNTFSDFNLYGPSTESSKRFQAGYTTTRGVIKPHLLSLYSFAFNRETDLPTLVSTDKLNVIPLSQPIDGTALKPGLEYDSLQKMVVGLTELLDQNTFSSNSIPDPEEMKKKLLTSAEVVVSTSSDNGSSIPVGVHYRSRSVTGEEMLKSIQDTAKTLETCQMCLKLQTSDSQIVLNDLPSCFSNCDDCLKLKSVCAASKKMARSHTFLL